MWEGGGCSDAAGYPQIIGVSGLSACGKSSFINGFQAKFDKYKIKRLSVGDAVRKKMQDKGIDVTYESLQVFNDALMNEYGKRYMSIIFDDIEDHLSCDVVFVDAVRTLSDFETLIDRFGDCFFTVGFSCEDEVRYNRVVSRARADDLSSRIDFYELTQKEIEWGVVEVLELAALTIDSNLMSLDKQCDYVFEYAKRQDEILRR